MSQMGSGQPEPRQFVADTEHARFRESRQKTINTLVTLADELDEILKGLQIARVAGAVIGIIAVGIRAGTPHDSDTHAAGTVLYWAAGITIAGTTVAKLLKNNMTTEAVNKVLKDDNAALMEYEKALNGVNVEVGIKSTEELQKVSVAAKIVGTVITLLQLPVDVPKLVSEYCDITTDTPQKLPTELRTLADKLKDDLEQLENTTAEDRGAVKSK